MKELRSISAIFGRDSGQYDESALLYRDILVYPIKNARENGNDAVQNSNKNAGSITFTRWQIAKWLRSNHSTYVTSCLLTHIGDKLAYTHGLHFCWEVNPYRNRNKIQSNT